MESSWENFDLHMEMDRDEDFLDMCHTEDDEFFRDILLQPPAFSSESETDNSSFQASSTVQNNSIATVVGAAASATDGGVILSPEEMGSGFGNMVKSNSSNSVVYHQQAPPPKRTRNSSFPRTYILSFDDSSVIPLTPEPKNFNYDQLLGSEGTRSCNSTLPSMKRSLENQNPEPRPRVNQGAKKARTSSQTMDHIVAERKRRQELTERFIALSATIPGLNKTDKASILRAAIDYLKQLQERVKELEKQDKKRSAESMIFIKRSELSGNEDSISSETSSNDCDTLPEIEARVLGKEVLIEIHCEKENGIELKILDHLENLHLFVTGCSALPFGNYTLGITIIAQMCEAYKMTGNDLVKNLRQVLLKSQIPSTGDPY